MKRKKIYSIITNKTSWIFIFLFDVLHYALIKKKKKNLTYSTHIRQKIQFHLIFA